MTPIPLKHCTSMDVKPPVVAFQVRMRWISRCSHRTLGGEYQNSQPRLRSRENYQNRYPPRKFCASIDLAMLRSPSQSQVSPWASQCLLASEAKKSAENVIPHWRVLPVQSRVTAYTGQVWHAHCPTLRVHTAHACGHRAMFAMPQIRFPAPAITEPSR